MKHVIRILITLAALTAMLIAGCVSTGMDRSIKASNSIRDVDAEVGGLNVRIDFVATSLDTLLKSGQADLKKNFDAFSSDIPPLEKQGALVLKREEEMNKASKEYFSEWQKQGTNYTNPQIRKLSDERRVKLAKIYDKVLAGNEGIKVAYYSYLSDLKEIQSFLNTDLTPSGVASIEPIAQKTVAHLYELRKSLNPMIAALVEIQSELYEEKTADAQ
jgi:outer membrane murein-binding lipoprotein Lpp